MQIRIGGTSLVIIQRSGLTSFFLYKKISSFPFLLSFLPTSALHSGPQALEVRGYRWLGSLSSGARGLAAPKAVMCHTSHPSRAELPPWQNVTQLGTRSSCSGQRRALSEHHALNGQASAEITPGLRPAPPRRGQASSPSICFWCFQSPPRGSGRGSAC